MSSQQTADFEFTDYSKFQSYPDFFFPCSDSIPSHPDVLEFDAEIDSTLEGFDAQNLLPIVNNDFTYLRTVPRPCGPLSGSAFTESAYESTGSENAYNPPSPKGESVYSYSGSTYSSSFDLEMALEFRSVCVGDYSPQSGLDAVNDTIDPTSFGALPPTPPRSPPAPSPVAAIKGYQRTSFSDYGPRRSSITQDLYPQINFNTPHLNAHSTVSPVHISSPPAVVQTRPILEEHKMDMRKKYRCDHCPRAFARAYNLKTHKATHDPNRLKPHVCHYHNCGRSFSRKHDLGRHLTSIHREDARTNEKMDNVIGLASSNGKRVWCDNCGKSSIGRSAPCDCVPVK